MKKTIDIFCDIIDNYGDIGIVYRLSKELSLNNYNVRIFVNKLHEVTKLIENFDEKLSYQKIEEIEFYNLDNFSVDKGGEVIIEAFGTNLPDSYVENLNPNSKIIINLEYLTAESWALDFHLKNSISPKSFIEKVFYMPGFVKNSGGIILDSNYLEISNNIRNNKKKYFNEFYRKLNLKYNEESYYINIFTYTWKFKPFLESIKNLDKKFVFFILDKKIEIPEVLPNNIEIYTLDYMKQKDFDIFINLADFNFIRGEDSIIRTILSEIPFVWNIYPQEEDYHLLKLEAFLDRYVNKESNFYKMNWSFNSKLPFMEDFINFIEEDKEFLKKDKEFLIENCNLITKLLNFIDSKLKNQEETK